jgi:protein-S-isoprenylcysteine O-methyltransferase Ste14
MIGGQQAAVVGIDAAWLAWLVIWIVLSLRVKAVVRRESRASRAAHLLPLLLAGALLLWRAPWQGSWLMAPLWPRLPWMLWAGAGLVLAGLGFAVAARLVLAGNWSGTVTLKQDHELIRRGPYRLVRHPIYTGLLTAMLGNAIAIDEVRGLVAFAILTASFVRKLRTEEAFMARAFGKAYADYSKDVARLIPGVW